MSEDLVDGMAERVEARLTERRLSPGGFAEAAGLTRQGLADVRKGRRKRYQAITIHGVAKALGWGPDWYERLLAGEAPVEEDHGTATSQLDQITKDVAELQDRLSQVEESLTEILRRGLRAP